MKPIGCIILVDVDLVEAMQPLFRHYFFGLACGSKPAPSASPTFISFAVLRNHHGLDLLFFAAGGPLRARIPCSQSYPDCLGPIEKHGLGWDISAKSTRIKDAQQMLASNQSVLDEWQRPHQVDTYTLGDRTRVQDLATVQATGDAGKHDALDDLAAQFEPAT